MEQEGENTDKIKTFHFTRLRRKERPIHLIAEWRSGSPADSEKGDGA